MKKLFTLLSFILLTGLCYAQRITYNDLYYVLYHDIGQTGTYLNNKGFNFERCDTSKIDSSELSFYFSKNSGNTNAYICVDKYSKYYMDYAVGFWTLYLSDVILFKKFAFRLGYKQTDAMAIDGSLLTVYKKGINELKFSEKKHSDLGTSSYYIILTDIQIQNILKEITVKKKPNPKM